MNRLQEFPGAEDLTRLYRETIGPLYGYVSRRAGRSRELAEDITQETYLRAVAEWGNGRRPDNPLAWLQTVARNLLLNHYRRRKPDQLEASRLAGVLDGELEEAPDATALIWWGLTRMGRRSARVLEDFYLEGKTTRTIATELGVSERAVEGRLRRAREAMRKLLLPLCQ